MDILLRVLAMSGVVVLPIYSLVAGSAALFLFWASITFLLAGGLPGASAASAVGAVACALLACGGAREASALYRYAVDELPAEASAAEDFIAPRHLVLLAGGISYAIGLLSWLFLVVLLSWFFIQGPEINVWARIGMALALSFATLLFFGGGAALIDSAADAPEAPTLARPAEPEPARTTTASEKLVGNRYEIDHLIGEGGMGMVYAGRDLKLGRFVAIKKMRADLKLNRRDKERFLKEARTSASLHHPCIVDIFDVVDQKNELYLVFEYVDGQTLDRRLDEGPVPAEELVSRLYFVCQALAFAHAKGVAHRDLKPSNIMLTRSGGAKVMDFGIAREIQDTISRMTNMDTSGTLAYMAPEQELGRSDARSDLYSLGITLYQALTGNLPFPGPNFMLQKERMIFEPLANAAPEAPEPLREAIERCLRYDPKERFQTIDDFAVAAGAGRR